MVAEDDEWLVLGQLYGDFGSGFGFHLSEFGVGFKNALSELSRAGTKRSESSLDRTFGKQCGTTEANEVVVGSGFANTLDCEPGAAFGRKLGENIVFENTDHYVGREDSIEELDVGSTVKVPSKSSTMGVAKSPCKVKYAPQRKVETLKLCPEFNWAVKDWRS